MLFTLQKIRDKISMTPYNVVSLRFKIIESAVYLNAVGERDEEIFIVTFSSNYAHPLYSCGYLVRGDSRGKS